MVWSHHIIYMLNGDSGESRNETSDHERYFIDDPIRRKSEFLLQIFDQVKYKGVTVPPRQLDHNQDFYWHSAVTTQG